MFHGITVSLTKRRIQEYQRQLGNGNDADLHLTIADLYQYLGENSLAIENYKSAARDLVKGKTPLEPVSSNQLIDAYKKILSLSPFDDETANKLGREYQCRGMHYRAVSLHTSLAERYTQCGEYHKAIEHYRRVFEIEPGSITVRQTCADLYCRIGELRQGAKEYMQIGDIYFDHQKFDGALKYYQQASNLNPDSDEVKQKILMTQQILEGTIIPQVQASLQKLCNMNHLKQSLAEKERIEQTLRHNIRQLKQRYRQSVKLKNQQLQATQQRLDELSTYVAISKDNLEQIELGKQHLKDQLAQELAHRKDLECKLTKLDELQVSECNVQSTDPQAIYVQRLESAVMHLQQEKTKLEKQLQIKLEQSSHRECRLRDHLANQTSRGEKLAQQLTTTTRTRDQVEQKLQQQLQESLYRERGLREQMRKLIRQHENALKQVEHEKRRYERKYRATQACMNVVEKHNMTALEQLRGELFRQDEIEANFSEKFHKSLQEIAMLLHNQEQEIQKLVCL